MIKMPLGVGHFFDLGVGHFFDLGVGHFDEDVFRRGGILTKSHYDTQLLLVCASYLDQIAYSKWRVGAPPLPHSTPHWLCKAK